MDDRTARAIKELEAKASSFDWFDDSVQRLSLLTQIKDLRSGMKTVDDIILERLEE